MQLLSPVEIIVQGVLRVAPAPHNFKPQNLRIEFHDLLKLLLLRLQRNVVDTLNQMHKNHHSLFSVPAGGADCRFARRGKGTNRV